MSVSFWMICSSRDWKLSFRSWSDSDPERTLDAAKRQYSSKHVKLRELSLLNSFQHATSPPSSPEGPCKRCNTRCAGRPARPSVCRGALAAAAHGVGDLDEHAGQGLAQLADLRLHLLLHLRTPYVEAQEARSNRVFWSRGGEPPPG